MSYEYLARVLRDDTTDTVMLQLIRDSDVVELMEADEFVTVSLLIDLFASRGAAEA